MNDRPPHLLEQAGGMETDYQGVDLMTNGTKRLANGWTLHEHHSTESVYVGTAEFPGGIARFYANVYRIPSKRELHVFHLNGTTPEQQDFSSQSAVRASYNPSLFPWFRKRLKGSSSWQFGTTVGRRIDEAEEFTRLMESLDFHPAEGLKPTSGSHLTSA